MNKIKEIVYTNNKILGYFEDDVYLNYTQEEKENIFTQIKNNVIRKDKNRKISSLISGLLMLGIAIVLAFLMVLDVIKIGEGQWFNYTFIIAGLILMWVVLYYVFGFIFYKKETINFHFKSHKTTNPNSCLTYASSNYYKYINKYMNYLSSVSFVIKEEKNKKDIPIAFGLRMPSVYKNLIFNGQLNINVPYFYFSFQNQKLIFLPGFIVYINGEDSEVFSNDELVVKNEGNVYQLFYLDKLIISLNANSDFDINFFRFKYEQIN